MNLWACHGPEDGQSINTPNTAPEPTGNGRVDDTCVDTDGASLSFADQPPAPSSRAVLSYSVPSGLRVSSILIERRTQGFGAAQPGNQQRYVASFGGEPIESLSLHSAAGDLTGVKEFTPTSATSGGDLTFELSCADAAGCPDSGGPVSRRHRQRRSSSSATPTPRPATPAATARSTR